MHEADAACLDALWQALAREAREFESRVRGWPVSQPTDRGAWFHVDAAWGGTAALSPRLRLHLAGIERADSVTWDAHKWLSVPIGAGMFFARHREAARRAFAISTSYMPAPTSNDTFEPYAETAQWTRRAIGLKVFMALAELGIEGYGRLVEHQAAMGDRLRACLREAGWEIVNDTPLPTVCFTHPDVRAERATASRIVSDIQAGGRTWISEVTLRGEKVLRATVTSYRSTEEDVAALVEEVERVRCTRA